MDGRGTKETESNKTKASVGKAEAGTRQLNRLTQSTVRLTSPTGTTIGIEPRLCKSLSRME
jgi:hypothetical protein